MMTEKIIAALEAKGFRRWTKGDYDRLYINVEDLGVLHCTYSKSGWETACYFDGEKISNSEARRIKGKAEKNWINVKTGEIFSTNGYGEKTSETEWVVETIQEMIDEAEAEIKDIVEEPEITEGDIQSYEDVVKEGRSLEGDLKAYEAFYKKFYTDEDDDDDTWYKMYNKALRLMQQKYPDDMSIFGEAYRRIHTLESRWEAEYRKAKYTR